MAAKSYDDLRRIVRETCAEEGESPDGLLAMVDGMEAVVNHECWVVASEWVGEAAYNLAEADVPKRLGLGRKHPITKLTERAEDALAALEDALAAEQDKMHSA